MKKPPSKVAHNWPPIFLSIATYGRGDSFTIVSIASRPKTSPNLIFCSIKMSPCTKFLYNDFGYSSTYLCLRRFAQRKSIPFVAWRSWILVRLTYLVGAWLAIFYTTFFDGLHGRERLLCCVFHIVFVLFLILGFGWLGCHHWCRLKKG
jgi:hypothetical protein